MKRLLSAVIVLSLFLLFIASCNNNSDFGADMANSNPGQDGLQKQENNKDNEINRPDKQDNAENAQTLDRNKLLEQAYEGKVDGVEFGIGANGNDIATKWGEPLLEGYFLGGLYMDYDDMIFLTNGYMAEDGTYDYGTVLIICYVGQDKMFGIKKGMTLDQIKGTLGEPDYVYEYESDDEWDELHGDNWLAVYYVGNYNVIVEFKDGESPIHAMYLKEGK